MSTPDLLAAARALLAIPGVDRLLPVAALDDVRARLATAMCLTNCSNCANDEGAKCKALYPAATKAAEVIQWWASNKSGNGDGTYKPGATGCPGHKARS